jgi:hypothetical protein
MVRPDWKSLNGLWEYSITPKNVAVPERFDGQILVPFAVESSLSGVGRTFTPEDALWYRTTFRVPSAWIFLMDILRRDLLGPRRPDAVAGRRPTLGRYCSGSHQGQYQSGAKTILHFDLLFVI